MAEASGKSRSSDLGSDVTPDSLATSDGRIGAYAKLARVDNGGPGFAITGSLVTIGSALTSVAIQ